MKASLSSKRRNVAVIVGTRKLPLMREKQWYYDRLTLWCNEHCSSFAFIMHDRDTMDDGQPKWKHIHMCLTMKSVGKGRNYATLLTILNSISKELEIESSNAIEIDEMTSECGSIQYLIHKRDSDKAQYDENEIITSYTADEIHTFMECDEQTLSVSYLVHVCELSKNSIEIMQTIGLKFYKEYRLVIHDILNDLRAKKWRKFILEGVVNDSSSN